MLQKTMWAYNERILRFSTGIPMTPYSPERINDLLSVPFDMDVLSALVTGTYSELRRIAAHYVRTEPLGQTLQPTALVHEAWMKVVAHLPDRFDNRAHFFGTFSRAMRQLLIDKARKRAADKNGGGIERVSLDRVRLGIVDPDYVPIHLALERLEVIDKRMAAIVALHFFGGFTCREIGRLLDMGESTVREEWSVARAWLQAALGGPTE
jgi:RNA polymerase sigma factor (TIGR02999 family)